MPENKEIDLGISFSIDSPLANYTKALREAGVQLIAEVTGAEDPVSPEAIALRKLIYDADHAITANLKPFIEETRGRDRAIAMLTKTAECTRTKLLHAWRHSCMESLEVFDDSSGRGGIDTVAMRQRRAVSLFEYMKVIETVAMVHSQKTSLLYLAHGYGRLEDTSLEQAFLDTSYHERIIDLQFLLYKESAYRMDLFRENMGLCSLRRFLFHIYGVEAYVQPQVVYE